MIITPITLTGADKHHQFTPDNTSITVARAVDVPYLTPGRSVLRMLARRPQGQTCPGMQPRRSRQSHACLSSKRRSCDAVAPSPVPRTPETSSFASRLYVRTTGETSSTINILNSTEPSRASLRSYRSLTHHIPPRCTLHWCQVNRGGGGRGRGASRKPIALRGGINNEKDATAPLKAR